MKESISISQSSVKGMVDYLIGEECGKLLMAKYFDGILTESTAQQKLGQYFEYRLTGSLPKGGNVPQPEKVYKGTSKEALAADYQKVEEVVIYAKELFKEFGIEVIKAGYYISTTDGWNGTIDVYAKWERQNEYNPSLQNEETECFIDIKLSALIDDKWNPLGWRTDSLPEKHRLMIQGVHYKLLANKVGIHPDIPFYYFIFNPKNPKDAKIIYQHVEDATFESHQNTVERAKKFFEEAKKTPLKANPSPKRCNNCPIRESCTEKTVFPIIESVSY